MFHECICMLPFVKFQLFVFLVSSRAFDERFLNFCRVLFGLEFLAFWHFSPAVLADCAANSFRNGARAFYAVTADYSFAVVAGFDDVRFVSAALAFHCFLHLRRLLG